MKLAGPCLQGPARPMPTSGPGPGPGTPTPGERALGLVIVRIVVLREAPEGERRVALTPQGAAELVEAGHSVVVESGAGERSGFLDEPYRSVGATVVDRETALGDHGVVLAIDGHVDGLSDRHAVIGLVDPLWRPEAVEQLARSGATIISLELIPRTTRAQTMDVLSSMATVTGTEAVLLAARRLPKMFPLMITAAGTVPPARVLVLGAGVAGLQAIATAKRLGAVVEGYDVRPAAAEQIRSLGARAVELDVDTADSEDTGGYARQQDADTAARQRELLSRHVAQADVVITTAAIPGAASPLLVTTEMVEAMAPGSVIVDLAAERGGNCELTRLDESVVHHGVSVLGPSDLASGSSATASHMFTNNVIALLGHLADEGDIELDLDDEITAAVLVARGGDVVHPRVVERLT